LGAASNGGRGDAEAAIARLGGILAGNVTFSNPTTEELLKRAEDVIRQNQDYLKDFMASVDQLLRRQEQFRAEHPAFGDRYS
jgi:hypothetical protein